MWRMLLSLAIVLCLGIGVAEAKPKPKPKEKPAPTISPEEVFMTLDKNSDGTLTLDEYLVKKTPELKDQAEKAFKEVDKEGEGLTLQQFTKNFAKLNIKAPPPKKEKAPPPKKKAPLPKKKKQ